MQDHHDTEETEDGLGSETSCGDREHQSDYRRHDPMRKGSDCLALGPCGCGEDLRDEYPDDSSLPYGMGKDEQYDTRRCEPAYAGMESEYAGEQRDYLTCPADDKQCLPPYPVDKAHAYHSPYGVHHTGKGYLEQTGSTTINRQGLGILTELGRSKLHGKFH